MWRVNMLVRICQSVYCMIYPKVGLCLKVILKYVQGRL